MTNEVQVASQVGPGRPPIAPVREQFSMVLPKPILDEIRATATAEGNSVAAVVRRRLAASKERETKEAAE